MDIQGLHKLIDEWAAKQPSITFSTPNTGSMNIPAVEAEKQPEEPKKELPEGKRVVRTPTSGDRVYLLDEVKKTRQWLATPEALSGAGFDMGDVGEVKDTDLYKYSMGATIYKAPDA